MFKCALSTYLIILHTPSVLLVFCNLVTSEVSDRKGPKDMERESNSDHSGFQQMQLADAQEKIRSDQSQDFNNS